MINSSPPPNRPIQISLVESHRNRTSSYNLVECDAFNEEQDSRDTKDLVTENDGIILDGQAKVQGKWAKVFGNAGLFGTSFNFINSIIGSGVIGMPYAFSLSGIGPTFILLALIAALTDFSIISLIASGEIIGVKTYQELVNYTMGTPGYVMLITIQFLYPFISLISYNIIIGDTITKVLIRLLKIPVGSILVNRYFIIAIFTAFVTLPLSLLRNISKLAKTSFISCVLIIGIAVVMFIRMLSMDVKDPIEFSDWKGSKRFDGVIDSFSLIAFGFMCHHNSFLIYHSMDEPNTKNWKKVTHISVSISILFSGAFGLIGYLTFAGLTEGDIFENYCYKDDIINVARLCYAVIIMFSFPLECFVCRDVIQNTFFSGRKDSDSLHFIITIVVVFITIVLSFLTDCLGIILELNGALVATMLAYVMPSLCTIIIYTRISRGEKQLKKIILSCLVCLIGVTVAISGLVSIIHKVKNGYTCSHGKEPAYCFAQESSQSKTTTMLLRYMNLTTEA